MVPANAHPQVAGATELSFIYTVQQSDTSTAALSLLASPVITLCCDATAYIKRSGSQAVTEAVRTLPALTGTLISAIDTTIPTVSSIAAQTLSGTYNFGQSIYIDVTFTTPITAQIVNGNNPELDLIVGQTAGGVPIVRAALLTLDPTVDTANDAILVFELVVEASDSTLDLAYTSTSALRAANSVIRRASSVPVTAAVLTLPAVGAANSLDDTSAVVITAAAAPTIVYTVFSQPAATYSINDDVVITVRFSRPVRWQGTVPPTLELNVGVPYIVSTLTPANALQLDWRFIYTVQPTHTSADLQYTSITALVAPTGTVVVDATFTNVVLTLPALGSILSLAGSSAVVLQSSTLVTSVVSLTADGVYHCGESIMIRFVAVKSHQ
jgi:hypothetical protein